MSEEKTYLSITADYGSSQYVIKTHPVDCYIRWRKMVTTEMIRPVINDDFKRVRFANIEHLATALYDILFDYVNNKEGLNDQEDIYIKNRVIACLQNLAYRITLDYFNDRNDNNSVMWDITDWHHAEQIEDPCECCDICDDDDDDDENEENETEIPDGWYSEIKSRFMKHQRSIDSLDDAVTQLEYRMGRLEDEVFTNEELTARAQIKMTNKRLDKAEEKLSSIIDELTMQVEDLKKEILDTNTNLEKRIDELNEKCAANAILSIWLNAENKKDKK